MAEGVLLLLQWRIDVFAIVVSIHFRILPLFEGAHVCWSKVHHLLRGCGLIVSLGYWRVGLRSPMGVSYGGLILTLLARVEELLFVIKDAGLGSPCGDKVLRLLGLVVGTLRIPSLDNIFSVVVFLPLKLLNPGQLGIKLIPLMFFLLP